MRLKIIQKDKFVRIVDASGVSYDCATGILTIFIGNGVSYLCCRNTKVVESALDELYKNGMLILNLSSNKLPSCGLFYSATLASENPVETIC